MNRFKAMTLLTHLAICAGCTAPPPPNSSPDQWSKIVWVIRRVYGEEVSHRASIRFSENGGCTISACRRSIAYRYSKTLNSVVPGSGLRFYGPKIAFELRHCEYWSEDLYFAYLDAFKEVFGYWQDGRDLLLLGRNGEEILAFRARY